MNVGSNNTISISNPNTDTSNGMLTVVTGYCAK